MNTDPPDGAKEKRRAAWSCLVCKVFMPRPLANASSKVCTSFPLRQSGHRTPGRGGQRGAHGRRGCHSHSFRLAPAFSQEPKGWRPCHVFHVCHHSEERGYKVMPGSCTQRPQAHRRYKPGNTQSGGRTATSVKTLSLLYTRHQVTGSEQTELNPFRCRGEVGRNPGSQWPEEPADQQQTRNRRAFPTGELGNCHGEGVRRSPRSSR